MGGGIKRWCCLTSVADNDVVCAEPDHVLGTCSLHRSPQQVHDQLLLGQEHLLPAVEQTDTEIRIRLPADGSLLPVDTVHTARPGSYNNTLSFF